MLLIGVGLGSVAVAPAAAYAFPPVNTAAPTITGTTQESQVLTEGHGSWTNGPYWNFHYQWQRCNSSGSSCSSIAGASAQAYAQVAADVGHRLRVQEIVSNFSGTSSPAESAATAVVVPPAPGSISAPTITGTAQLGQTLTEVNGVWTNSPTGYAYQWLRCNSSGTSCAPIPGASAQTYKLAAADVGYKLRVHETASNAGGSASSPESQPTAVIDATPQTVVTPPAAVVISIRSLTVDRHGNALIPVQCPAGASAGCSGEVTITMRVVVTHSKRARGARCARGCRPLGTTNYQARAGQKVRVRVHIASIGRRLLTQHRSVKVTLAATSVLDGQTATVTRAIELKAPARQG